MLKIFIGAIKLAFKNNLLKEENKFRINYLKDRPKDINFPKDLINKIKKNKIGVILGSQIYMVNDEIIRDELDIDFTIGGNPCRYLYIPMNEIWISMYLSPSDYSGVIVHEMVESLLMKKGFSYDSSHNKANIFEYKLRKKIDVGEIIIENNNDALKCAKEIIQDFLNHES